MAWPFGAIPSLIIMEELHLTKKDFKIDWYSGTGKGGQKRNKVKACCRITHIASGITVNGTASRSRVDNQRTAFNKLAKLVITWYSDQEETEFNISDQTVRNYHAERNEVLDKASGLKQSYKKVVTDGDLSDMIAARRRTIGGDD